MSKLTNFFVVFIISVVATEARRKDARSEDIKGFQARNKIVNKLADKLELYFEKENTPENETRLEDFLNYFDETFDNSDRWLYNALIKRNYIIKSVLNDTGYNYTFVKEFIEDSKSLLDAAYDLHVAYLKLQGNDSIADKVEGFQKYAGKKMKKLRSQTLNYIKYKAWKKQFRKDAYKTIMSQLKSKDLNQTLLSILSSKFPFRSWLILIIDRRSKTRFCASGEYYKQKIGSRRRGKIVYVFQFKAKRSDKKWLARQTMRNLRLRKSYEKCGHHLHYIVRESKYNCRRGSLPLFAIIRVDEMKAPQIAFNEKRSPLIKDLERSSRGRCTGDYKVIIMF